MMRPWISQEMLFSLILNSALDGLIGFGLNGNVTMINKQGCKLLELDCGSVIGKNFIDNFIPKEIKGEIKKVFSSVINKKQVQFLILTMR